MFKLSAILTLLMVSAIMSFAQEDIVSVKHMFGSTTSNVFKIHENENGSILFGTRANQSSVFLGYNAGLTFDQSGIGGNTIIGYNAFSNSETGSSNTAVGFHALLSMTTGSGNTAIGAFALQANTIGIGNVAIGDKALKDHQGNLFGGMIAVGSQALAFDKTGNNTIAIGSNAAFMDTMATESVYIGGGAGSGSTSPGNLHSKTENVMIGHVSGFLAKGSENVFIGNESGFSALGSGNIYLGNKSGMNAKGDNQLYIDNSSADSLNALIYGQFDTNKLRVNGDLTTFNMFVNGSLTTPNAIFTDDVEATGVVTAGSITVDGKYDLPFSIPSTGDVMKYDGSDLIWDNLFTPWVDGSGSDVYYNSGDVGVGTTAPDYRMDIVGNAAIEFVARIQNSNAGAHCDGLLIEAGPKIGNPGASAVFIEFQKSGGSSPLGEIAGNGSGGIAYNQTSDRRLKQGIEDYQSGLSTLMEIKPRVYQMKVSPNVDEVGFIAQELYESFPQIVSGKPSDDIAEDGPMAVDYGRLTPVLVAAIQDQQKIIEALQKRLDEKDDQFEMLKAEISKMNLSQAQK